MFSNASSPTDIVPPPAYEVSQEEFDQKTSHAIERSSSAASPVVDQDGWPIYNETAFEVVASSYRRASDGTSSEVVGRERRVAHRRATSDMKITVPRLKPAERRRRNPNPGHDIPENDDGRSTPPPPFASVGPSHDGPPFEEVVRLSYRPDSRMASPLSSPQPLRPRDLPQPMYPTRSNTPAHSHSSSYPTASAPRVVDRPTAHRASTGVTSRLDFDPSVAYTKPTGFYANMQATQTPRGATAFYNHAVASQLTNPIVPSQQPELTLSSPYRTHRVSPSMPNIPSFGAQPSGTNVYRPSYAPSSPSPQSANTPTGAPQWANSEAQLLRDLYHERG